MESFVLGTFGGVTRSTLRSAAFPYKVVATGLVLREERASGRQLTRADLRDILRAFGMQIPATIANWTPGRTQPKFDRPVGMVGAMVRGPSPFVRVDGVNIGCATCHSAPLYDANGRATDTLWVGMPNASLDIDAFSRAVLDGLRIVAANPGAARKRLAQLFPETSGRERFTIRWFVIPQVKRFVRQRGPEATSLAPYASGGPGLTNGLGALKDHLHYQLGDSLGGPEVAYTSIPDLSGRSLRTSLLYDGTYAPLGDSAFAPRDRSMAAAAQGDRLAEVVAFFTVPTMGLSPDKAERQIPAVRDAMRWVTTRYRSPRFPGAIDTALASEGAQVYAERCQACHGMYEAGGDVPRRLVSFPNRLVPQEMMGTDSSRWSLVRPDVARQLKQTAFGRHMDVRRTGGYVAPILNGVWATAPYLHNGSVPTLWMLLTPEERADRFPVGGHSLDYRDVGIALERGPDGWQYPPGYSPWSVPQIYDTRQAGKSNRGHERQVEGLDDVQKRSLIEYLKTLYPRSFPRARCIVRSATPAARSSLSPAVMCVSTVLIDTRSCSAIAEGPRPSRQRNSHTSRRRAGMPTRARASTSRSESRSSSSDSAAAPAISSTAVRSQS